MLWWCVLVCLCDINYYLYFSRGGRSILCEWCEEEKKNNSNSPVCSNSSNSPSNNDEEKIGLLLDYSDDDVMWNKKIE